MKQFNFISTVIGLIASLLSIFNVFLALPSVFKDIDASYLVNITNKNFALKLGFILILQFGIGYILASIIAIARRGKYFSTAFSIVLLLVLISSWLTFFNISEILYTEKIKTVAQHFGMLIFLLLTFLIQALLIISSRWEVMLYESYIYGVKKHGERTYSKTTFESKISTVGLLLFFEVVLFIVYWIN